MRQRTDEGPFLTYVFVSTMAGLHPGRDDSTDTQKLTGQPGGERTSGSGRFTTASSQRVVTATTAPTSPNDSNSGTNTQGSRTIPAIPITIQSSGRIELGAIAHLASNASLELVDEGFDPRTVRVRCKGLYYIVFRQDLERIDSRQRDR